MKISKSKRHMSALLIDAGVTQFPEGANWAAQDRDGWRDGHPFGFYTVKPHYNNGSGMWNSDSHSSLMIDEIYVTTLIPNWHQTILSRNEFDQIAAETVVSGEPELVELTSEDPDRTHGITVESPDQRAKLARIYAPSLDQLLQDWRNADDYAQRKQTEADEAAVMRDERWRDVQARADEMGVTVGLCETVAAELVITDWRQLREGDFIWVASEDGYIVEGEHEVLEIESAEYDGTRAIRVERDGFRGYWIDIDNGWRFIRRP